MYFSLDRRTLKSYLQWYPFAKLSDNDLDKIRSQEFFNNFIKTPGFLSFQEMRVCSKHYILKGDGSFRKATLISPVLYLVLQAIGREIYQLYNPTRGQYISVYYSGDYASNDPRHKQRYSDFYKELNSIASSYKYYIKTDISDFFSSINVDILIDRINEICNKKNKNISMTHLYLYKEILKYCGNGSFPIVENSMTCSYLATVVYLDMVDKQLYDYIYKIFDREDGSSLNKFRMIRYVDDLYIFFNSDDKDKDRIAIYNDVLNNYASYLKEVDLSINSKKSCLKESKDIREDLNTALYNEEIYDDRFEIEFLSNVSLINFLEDIYNELVSNGLDKEKYNNLINDHFSSDDIEYLPKEVLNYMVYELSLRKDGEETKLLEKLVEYDYSFLKLDTKPLMVLIMKTESEKAIKSVLNQFFNRHRKNNWNLFDTLISIEYLLQRNFKHTDLLKVLSEQEENIYHYCDINCKGSFLRIINYNENVKHLTLVDIVNKTKDEKLYYLYFMYLVEIARKNYLAAYAYFKNFFDRVTADLAFYTGASNGKAPRYNQFYKENQLKDFYKENEESLNVIKEAHKFRNENPLSHSSSKLIEGEVTSETLLSTIEKLMDIIYYFIENELKLSDVPNNSL